MSGTRIAVSVATTRGPVRIQRIVPENPSVRSVICLDGALSALPVSGGYDAFVREPTGVIERMTGHAVYRVDVAGPIEAGDSWHLGLFLAHAFQECGALADPGDPGDVHLLVTGSLDRALRVGAVSHVAEKLDRAPQAGGIFVLPAAGERPEPRANWNLLPVEHAEDVLLYCLGAERAADLLHPPAVTGSGAGIFRLKARAFGFLAGISALTVLCLAYPLWSRLDETGTPSGEEEGVGSILSLELVPRKPGDGSCGTPVVLAPDAEEYAGPVCYGRVTITRSGEYLISLSLTGPFSDYVDEGRYRREVHGFSQGGDQLSLNIDFPYWVQAESVLKVEAKQLSMDGSAVISAHRTLRLVSSVTH